MKFGLYFCQIIFVIIFIACRSTPPQNPDAKTVTWVTYTNEKIQCSVNYPDVYALDEDDDRYGVIFRYDGFPVMLVRFTDEEEARHHGLWFGHQAVGEIEMAGIRGEEYDYKHSDGPFYMRTISYVVPYQNKYLALEFRTDRDELDDVQKYIISSFEVSESKKEI